MLCPVSADTAQPPRGVPTGARSSLTGASASSTRGGPATASGRAGTSGGKQDHCGTRLAPEGQRSLSAVREHSCQGLAAGSDTGEKRHSSCSDWTWRARRRLRQRPRRAMPPADGGRALGQSAVDNERCQSVSDTPLYLAIPKVPHARRHRRNRGRHGRDHHAKCRTLEVGRFASTQDLCSRREEVRLVGRKSRAKAEHRATRATMPGREARPTDPVGWPRRRDLDVGLTPDRPSSLTQGSPPGVRQAPPSPLRAVPAPAATARPEPYEKLAVLVARRAAAQEALEHEIRALLGEGCSWTAIGRVLGLSRQGARQRYHHLLAGNGSSPGPSSGPDGPGR